MDLSITLNPTALINDVYDQTVQHGEDILGNIPNLEMQFENEEVAYNFYNAYARGIGFGIRKEYKNTSNIDGLLTSRRFCCHKEGERGKDKRNCLIKEARAETRTRCDARMSISLDRKIGKYKVVDFIEEHNHPLQPQRYVHMIRSQRKITELQAAEIDMANDCGMSIRDFNEFLVKKAGGRDNLGFIKVDQKNYLRTKRHHTFRFGEVSALLTYFKEQARKDPSFFYEFQLDAEEQVTNIFWADAEMINDYKYFGDVSAFDATYQTNKDYRPLAVFVGYNNHRETLVFGASLMYDETSASFEWLFKTFVKAMGGKKPKTIFTDQDAAMAKAFPTTMPETFHGLCTWHIRENALRHVNHLYHDNPQFSRDFEACIDVYETEEEFLSAWNAMLVEYDVSNKSWLHTIYKVKEKWAWAYVNKAFTTGMRSTQLSESLNSDLKSHLKSDLNMVDFFTHFERVVNSKRYNESKVEHDSIHKLPRLKMKKAPMLVQAGNIYTPKIFEEFQEDYEESLGAYIKDHKEDQFTHVYTIANFNETKERIVVSNTLEGSVYCDCRKFETHGILCSHALKVLDIMNIKLIPDKYILERWTREARRGDKIEWKSQHEEVDAKAHFTQRYRELCPRFGNLVNRACESHESYTFLSKVWEESAKVIEQLLSKRQHNGGEINGMCNTTTGDLQQNENRIEDRPDYSCIKGIKKRQCPYKGRSRPKNWLEKSNRKANANPKTSKKNHLVEKARKHTVANSTTKSKADTTRNEKQSHGTHVISFERPQSEHPQYRAECSIHEATNNINYTELLTESRFNSSHLFCHDYIRASQYNEAN